ncbi:hypothetical protein ACFL4N_04530 [Thermodesulfobacteriota bacterium]
MTRDSSIKIAILLLGFFIFSASTPWLGIDGKVVEVQGGKVKIIFEGKYVPRIGDKVSIGFRLGNDFIPVEGNWKIIDINAEFAWASAKGSGAGKPGLDYEASVSTQNPQKRADLGPKQKKKDKGGNYIPFIPALKASVEKLRFFESGYGKVDPSLRMYKKRFSAKNSRYINWEILLKHPMPNQKTDFKINAKYYRPDGRLYAENNMNTYIDPKWTESQHFSGWGSKNPGTWKEGKYTVEIFVKDQKVAQESFTVY